ncbi:MAG: hypothetical protein HS113_24680 [Verrucomicrobiales bacterium]|nr:hypothetical protein [Verrucomicrobiales bacterium]
MAFTAIGLQHVNLSRGQPPRSELLRSALAGLLLLLTIASAHAGLHHALHADASHAGHECLFTLLATGGVDLAPEAKAPLPPPAALATSREAVVPYASFSEISLPPSCGPPLA